MGQNVTFFGRFTFYLTENRAKKPRYRALRQAAVAEGEGRAKRHVFWKIAVLGLVKNAYQNVTFFGRFAFYLTENGPKKPGIYAGPPAFLWRRKKDFILEPFPLSFFLLSFGSFLSSFFLYDAHVRRHIKAKSPV